MICFGRLAGLFVFAFSAHRENRFHLNQHPPRYERVASPCVVRAPFRGYADAKRVVQKEDAVGVNFKAGVWNFVFRIRCDSAAMSIEPPNANKGLIHCTITC